MYLFPHNCISEIHFISRLPAEIQKIKISSVVTHTHTHTHTHIHTQKYRHHHHHHHNHLQHRYLLQHHYIHSPQLPPPTLSITTITISTITNTITTTTTATTIAITITTILLTGVNPGGMGGCIPPPTFLGGGGMACTNIPPLFENKITLNLTFIVKKLTFLTVKLLKTQKIARSHKNVFWDSIFAVFPVSWHLCKERCRIKQTLCNSMARKSIAGLPMIQVKGTWRSQRIITEDTHHVISWTDDTHMFQTTGDFITKSIFFSCIFTYVTRLRFRYVKPSSSFFLFFFLFFFFKVCFIQNK